MSGAPPATTGGLLVGPPDLLTDRPGTRAASIAFAGALLLLAFWDLAGRSLHHADVPRFAVIAREMLRTGDWLLPTQHGEPYANKPILYVWLVGLASLSTGIPTAFTVRLPSALAFVAAAWTTAAWGRRRSGSVVTGRLAGLLFATTFFAFALGRSGRPDMCAAAFGTAAAMALDGMVLGRGGRRDAWVAGACLGAGLLTKGPVVLLLPLALVLIPRATVPFRERCARARLGLVLPLAVLVAGLWIVPAWLRAGSGFVENLVVRQTLDRVAGQANHVEAWWYYGPSFLASALPWTPAFLALPAAFAASAVRARLGDAAHVLAAVVVLVVLSLVPTKQVRYALVLVPPLAVATAQVASDFASRLGGRTAPYHALRGVAIVSLLAVGGAAIVATRWPAALPFALPPLVLLAGCAATAFLAAARPEATGAELAGRTVGLAVVFFACGLLVYGSLLGRHLVPRAVAENQAVAAVLEPGVPIVLFTPGSAGGLEPDDLYLSAPDVGLAREAGRIPSPAAAPRLFVVCLDGDEAAAAAARGEVPRAVLERARPGGRTLRVLRFGPP